MITGGARASSSGRLQAWVAPWAITLRLHTTCTVWASIRNRYVEQHSTRYNRREQLCEPGGQDER
jgi:hypothetical protein